MLNTFVKSAVSVVLCSSSLAGQAQPESTLDVNQFFRSVQQISRQADGQRLAFRFRIVDSPCEEESTKPNRIQDGVTRISYRADSILVDQMAWEMSPHKTTLPSARRTVTYYSLTTGEYARSTKLAGGDEDVVLDHWVSLPPIVYFSLGWIESPFALDGCGHPELTIDDDGVHRAIYTNPTGSRITFAYDLELGGRVRYVDAEHPDGVEHDRVYFYDWTPHLAGGPARPTLVTQGRTGPNGCVRQSLVWESIGGPWASESWDHVIEARSGVMDFRASDAIVSQIHTDRPIPIDEVLSWPVPLETEELPAAVYAIGSFEPAPLEAGFDFKWLAAGSMALAALAYTLRRSAA